MLPEEWAGGQKKDNFVNYRYDFRNFGWEDGKTSFSTTVLLWLHFSIYILFGKSGHPPVKCLNANALGVVSSSGHPLSTLATPSGSATRAAGDFPRSNRRSLRTCLSAVHASFLSASDGWRQEGESENSCRLLMLVARNVKCTSRLRRLRGLVPRTFQFLGATLGTPRPLTAYPAGTFPSASCSAAVSLTPRAPGHVTDELFDCFKTSFVLLIHALRECFEHVHAFSSQR
jgi:hypothetical protein